MANQEHLRKLRNRNGLFDFQQVKVWNQWRQEHPTMQIDLSGADLSGAYLSGADLRGANLSRANLNRADLLEAYLSGADLLGANLLRADLGCADLSRANLMFASLTRTDLHEANLHEADLRGADLIDADLQEANFSGSNLSGADLRGANLSRANLSGSNLSGADLRRANFSDADLSEANLSEADLSQAILVHTLLTNTTLRDCDIYGISVWDVDLDGAEQLNLIITPEDQPTITVDNLKVAQFIYLLLNNAEIRDVIDTIARKAVLILGHFTPERKAILDAIREALRIQGYLPILFDFEKPSSRDLTETISTLAHLARFVIADITDAKSIPQELKTIVPNLPSVPIQPLILSSQHEYGMFEHFTRFPWVLPIYCYTDQDHLLAMLQEWVIAPAEQKANELTPPK